MDELLNKLLEAEVLSPETKKELEDAFKTQMQASIDGARKETETTVRAELTTQWIKERDALIEAVDSKVSELLTTEITELKEDIERFRDLEAESAEKLVEAKSDMAGELKKDLTELVEKLDAFLEIRLASELDELKDDIEEVKKLEFGRKIYEAVATEYRNKFVDEEGVEKELHELREQFELTTKKMAEETAAREKLERKIKLDQVLEPLSGRQCEIMETILRNVATDDLEDGYKTFIGRVLKESTESTSEKEGKVLAEGTSKETDSKESKASTETKPTVEGVVVTGDVVIEGADNNDNDKPKLTAAERRKIQQLAGIIE